MREEGGGEKDKERRERGNEGGRIRRGWRETGKRENERRKKKEKTINDVERTKSKRERECKRKSENDKENVRNRKG